MKYVINFQKMPKRKNKNVGNNSKKSVEGFPFSISDFNFTHGLVYLKMATFSGFWPVQILPSGEVFGYSENLR